MTAARSDSVSQAGELRSKRIESLRAVAALAVLLGHVAVLKVGEDPERILDRTALAGGFGVYLFFTLSGYLLFWPFARRDYGGGESIDLRGYALNRALRILPLYFFVLVFLLLVQEDGGSLRQWLTFTSFSQNFSTDTFATVDGVMWSLVVEIHFYALLPLLAVALARVSRGSLRRAALVLGALAAASFLLRLVTFYLTDTPNLYVRYSIASLFFFFVSGMLLALLRVAWAGGPPGWLRGPLRASGAWALATLPLMAAVVAEYKLEALTAAAGFLLVGACVLPLRPGRVVQALEWRPLAAIGIASYSLYLWHQPILNAFVGLDIAPESFSGLLAVTAPLCLAVAFASYRLVEEPFLRLRRRWAESNPARARPRQRARS